MNDLSTAYESATGMLRKSLGEPDVGSAVYVVAHVHGNVPFAREAGRLLGYKNVGPLKARMATIHSQATDEARDVPAHHVRALHESPANDLGDENVSIKPLRLNDRTGTHVVIHDGKVRGTITPSDYDNGLTVHSTSGEMGARSYTDRPSAVNAIKDHYRAVAQGITKVVDQKGAKHAADGKFSSQSGTKASDDAKTDKPSKSEDGDTAGGHGAKWPSERDIFGGSTATPKPKVKRPAKPSNDPFSLPEGFTVRGTFGKRMGSSMSLDYRAKIKDSRGYSYGSLWMQYNAQTKTASLLNYNIYHNSYSVVESNTAVLGAAIIKAVKDFQKSIPDCEFFKPPKVYEQRPDGHQLSEKTIASIRDTEASIKEVFERCFDPEGRPNDFFGKGTIAVKVADSEVADHEVLTKIPKELRPKIVAAVKDELAACKFMPKKLAWLTDNPVAGVTGGEQAGAAAWALPTANGTIIRLMPSAIGKRQNGPQVSQAECFNVGQQLPVEMRPMATMTHEMGHALEFELKKLIHRHHITDLAERARATTEDHQDEYTPIRTAYREMQAEYVESMKPRTAAEHASGVHRVSKYGRKNFEENFAENWTAYRHGLYCLPKAKAFFDLLGTEKIQKLLSDAAQFYILNSMPAGAETYECTVESAEEPGTESGDSTSNT